MGYQENNKIQQIFKEMKSNERLFRINAGQGWAGKVVKKTKDFITLKNPHIFRAAPEGWHDICGWRSIEITPDMVGQKIAVFIFKEVKPVNKKKLRPEQEIIKNVLLEMGGIVEEEYYE